MTTETKWPTRTTSQTDPTGETSVLWAGGKIDAVRFQYQFNEINADQIVKRQYQVLCLSKSNYTALQESNVESLFSYKSDPFSVYTRNYKNYIENNNIQFIVYDRNQLDPNIIHLKFLQLIYSNNRYVIFKILNNYNQTQMRKT